MCSRQGHPKHSKPTPRLQPAARVGSWLALTGLGMRTHQHRQRRLPLGEKPDPLLPRLPPRWGPVLGLLVQTDLTVVRGGLARRTASSAGGRPCGLLLAAAPETSCVRDGFVQRVLRKHQRDRAHDGGHLQPHTPERVLERWARAMILRARSKQGKNGFGSMVAAGAVGLAGK